MAIGKRLSDKFRIVVVSDPALLGWDEKNAGEAHANYAMTYDVSRIPDHILKHCTVFTCKPLLKKWEHLVDSVRELATARVLFKHHVQKATNFPGWELDGEKGTVEDKTLDEIPLDVMREVAAVIVRKAGMDTTPFTPPPTLSADRMRYRVLHVTPAKTESATEQSGD